jgi:hypothetical protein
MKITIIENEKPNLGVCEMVCDKKLADHLDTWEITKFLNNHSVNLLIGNRLPAKVAYYILSLIQKVRIAFYARSIITSIFLCRMLRRAVLKKIFLILWMKTKNLMN